MFRPLLHYPYRLVPEALDVSGADLHGITRDVGFVPDGMTTGSGALRFGAASSRVRVPPHSLFQHLHALKIETTVRLTSLGQRRNLVEGHLSFAFFIRPDGVLQGTARGRQSLGGPLDWYGTDSKSGSPDGVVRTVPVDQWVRLTYLHDGFASLRLFLDDRLVAATSSLGSPIRPVGPRGVHIGNWPDADAYAFQGDIDDTRLWRWEPDAAYHQFFCRPPGRCWRAVSGVLAAHFSGPDGREQLSELLRCVGRIQYELIQAVRGQGEDAVRINEEFALRYRRLWCEGPIDGEDMAALVAEWLRWLREALGERVPDTLERLRRCFLATGLDPEVFGQLDWQDCDPAFAGYLRAVIELVS